VIRLTRRSLAVLTALAATTLAVAASPEFDPVTPAERARFRATPALDDTLRWLDGAAGVAPFVHVTSFGTSGAGRPLTLVVLDREGKFSPEAARAAGRTVVLIQNGIHGGEIDGKDACLLLIRDLVEGRGLGILDGVTVLIVPVLNPDGHERVSQWNRPNQNGPTDGMGFRTNAAGLDLNRDHLKVDSPEIRALLDLVARWRPHLHVDDHVTDGADHGWLLTYAWVEAPQAPPSIDAWLSAHMPAVVDATRTAGFTAGPYVALLDDADPAKGFSSYVGRPWYATGYWPLRNRPSILVENHATEPYEDRVRANRAFLGALLEEIARDPAGLRRAVETAEARTVALGRSDAEPSEVAIAWDVDDARGDTLPLPIREWFFEPSTALGVPILDFRPGALREIEVPWLHRARATVTAPRPRGYAVLPGRPAIEARLAAHDLRVQRWAEPREVAVDEFRVDDVRHAEATYQGRSGARGTVAVRRVTVTLPAGTLWIPADQPDFEVAVQLLEPESPDSLFAWGLLASESERKEYVEPRVLERWVRAAIVEDPVLREDWERAVADETFAADPRARWLWWYRRSPWWDDTVGRLPIFRVPGAPVGPASRTAP